LRLVDTAGLRATVDVVERLGIEVSERYLAGAALVLACSEDVAGLVTTVERVAPLSQSPVVAVLTKSDRQPDASFAVARARELVGAIAPGTPVLVASAERGSGLAEVLRAIVARLQERAEGDALDLTPITRERHRVAIGRALDEVRAFREAWEVEEVPATIAAVHLRAAARELDELVGSIGVDDVLDKLFRDFCVGK
jgi:tRNA modification GTPase